MTRKNKQRKMDMNSNAPLHYNKLCLNMVHDTVLITASIVLMLSGGLFALICGAFLMIYIAYDYAKIYKVKKTWDNYYGIKNMDKLLEEGMPFPEDDEE